MILFDLDPTEHNASYQRLQVSNLDRQYQFFRSIFEASISTNRIYVSQNVIKALNFHAIVCLHSTAGEFRKFQVTVGDHKPPDWIFVQALMDDFVNHINVQIAQADPVTLATYALWRLNFIHPFINGNGRTARIVAYYILCLRSGGLIGGTVSLPELLRRDRSDYVAALRTVDASFVKGSLDLSPLHDLVSKLLTEQISTIED